MTLYVVCPDCGYILFKLGDGSNAERNTARKAVSLRVDFLHFMLTAFYGRL